MKNVQNINRNQVAAVIAAIPATAIFTVEFVKKDKTVRKLNCRSGVIPRYERKTDRVIAKNPANIMTVYDMQNMGYRNFNIESTLSIRAEGTIFNVVG